MIRIPGQSSKVTLKEARKRLGLSKQDLSDLSEISISAINTIEDGGSFATNFETARLLAQALRLEVSDIEWPRGLSNRGRPPLTGIKITRITIVEEIMTCPRCFMELPVTGICDTCS